MDEETEKARFAELLLRTPDDPFKAALLLFPDNVPRALRIATEWPHDPQVKEHRLALVEDNDELHYLPSKADLARAVWSRMQRENGPDDDGFVKLAKLYAEVRGFIEKPSNVTNVNVQQNRVMVVKDHGDDSQWEQQLKSQQKALINGEFSVSKH